MRTAQVTSRSEVTEPAWCQRPTQNKHVVMGNFTAYGVTTGQHAAAASRTALVQQSATSTSPPAQPARSDRTWAC
ncbi:unnamed protein product [Gongylonema pulchrum]|uniref:Transposase n=1 Tax=Gongylonema pulchrum TaxID=637853 RepID=A0A183DN08_9BILA|nr:unnamed protein product [Gongylonema pulchrum]